MSGHPEWQMTIGGTRGMWETTIPPLRSHLEAHPHGFMQSLLMRSPFPPPGSHLEAHSHGFMQSVQDIGQGHPLLEEVGELPQDQSGQACGPGVARPSLPLLRGGQGRTERGGGVRGTGMWSRSNPTQPLSPAGTSWWTVFGAGHAGNAWMTPLTVGGIRSNRNWACMEHPMLCLGSHADALSPPLPAPQAACWWPAGRCRPPGGRI